MRRNWFEKKILILGLSRSGISSAKYLNEKGADCFITEKNEGEKQQIEKLKEVGIKIETKKHSNEFLDNSYLAIVSPGISPKTEIIQKLKKKNIEIVSEVELAYMESNKPFIALTGTNGKTTTTRLVSHILSEEYQAPVCGNIGIPPTSLLNTKLDYFVLEVSSYQLHFSPTFKPQIGVLLNLTPDHIDWHGSLENYFEAKTSMFEEKKQPAFAVFNAKDKKVFEFGINYTGEKFFFGKEFEKNCCYIKENVIYFKRKSEEKIIDIQDLTLVGEHNYQNIMASIIVAKIIGIKTEKIIHALKTFKAVEHRLEFVKKIKNTEFYNDSKATNPEAAIVALNSFAGKSLTLIAGGRDKNTDLKEFCETILNTAQNVILIGEATQRFKENLLKNGFENIFEENTLESAIKKSLEFNTQISLLSPACASFDMFENFEKRGEAFKNYVISEL